MRTVGRILLLATLTTVPFWAGHYLGYMNAFDNMRAVVCSSPDAQSFSLKPVPEGQEKL